MPVGHIKLPIKPKWSALGGIKAITSIIEEEGIVDFTFDIKRECGMRFVTFEFILWDNKEGSQC